MTALSPNDQKRLDKLRNIVETLRREPRLFESTSLTSLKSLCKDPAVAARFTFYLATLAEKTLKKRTYPEYVTTEQWATFQKLAAMSVKTMRPSLKQSTTTDAEPLRQLLSQARKAQNQYRDTRWSLARTITCRELLQVELALECLLTPWSAPVIAYRAARQHAERYAPQFGTGLIPDSATSLAQIIAFWKTDASMS